MKWARRGHRAAKSFTRTSVVVGVAAALLGSGLEHARADGGAGGDSASPMPGTGGAGGTTGQPGTAGTIGAHQHSGGGGGGGSGGGAGGAGGGALGGAGGTSVSPNGQQGGADNDNFHSIGSGGGGGGAGGQNGNGAGVGTIDNTSPLTGGAGGTGGDGGPVNSTQGGASGGGGGGGAGGIGAIITSSGINESTITGGQGGAGGNAGSPGTFGQYGNGGAGGDGGVGVAGPTAGGSFTNIGTITGGLGGTGGNGTVAGSAGAGGAGFTGNSVTFQNLAGAIIKGGAGGSDASIPGGNGGAGGAGVSGDSLNIINNGAVTGGAGGSYGAQPGPVQPYGGNGGAGFSVTNSTITNGGTITGGAGGAGAGAGGLAGVGISASNTTITNTGTITGGNTGNLAGGGTAITGSNLTVINSGSITGGQDVFSDIGYGIQFTGGVNSLELRAGYTFTFSAAQAFSAADTLILGGSTNASFSLSQMGYYQNFGTLEKTGTSTWTVTDSTATAIPIVIAAGTLNITGSLPGAVTVNSGGTLSGNGTIGGLVAFGGGTVAPASSFGTLNVNGTVFFASGSAYQVNTNAAGQANMILATGGAKLAGGTVNVVASAGNYAPQTTYTILRASTVGGTFSGVTSNFAFLTPTLSYDASDVFLTLSLNGGGGGGGATGFAAGAQTSNQRAVGVVLDRAFAGASGDFATVLNALSVLSTAQGPAALDAISGQQYAGLGSFTVASGAAFMNAIGGQMGFLHGPSGGNWGVSPGGNAGAGRIALTGACDFRASDACDADPHRWGAWMSAVGGVGSVPGNANGVDTMGYNFGGTAIGTDYRFDPHFLAGVSLGYGTGTQWINGLGGTATSNAYNLSIYGSYTQGPVYVDGLAGYAYTDENMTRPIVIPGLNSRVAFGHTIANQFLGQVEAGYRFGIYAPAEAELIPFARLQGSTSTQAGFTESGASSLDLIVQQQTTNSLLSILGLDLAGKLDIGASDRLALKFRLGWAHENADTSRPVTAAFAGAPAQGFAVFGASPQRDSAVIGLAADTHVAESTSIYLRYDGLVGNGADSHVLSAGLRLTW